jgi:hypothetical protein
MLAYVYLLLANTYTLFILLGYRARHARKATVFFEVLREVMGRSIGPATISSPFSGAGALRVVYAPEMQAILLGFPWFFLDLFAHNSR